MGEERGYLGELSLAERVSRMTEFFLSAVSSPAAGVVRGSVPAYVQSAIELMAAPPGGQPFPDWQDDQVSSLEHIFSACDQDQHSFVEGLLKRDPDLAKVSRNVQLPFMIKLMRMAGLSETTISFIRTGFTHGFRYV